MINRYPLLYLSRRTDQAWVSDYSSRVHDGNENKENILGEGDELFKECLHYGPFKNIL